MMKRPRAIVIVSPGGLERGGGVGSVTRAIHAWLGVHAPDIPVFVLDAHGSSRLHQPLALLASALRLVVLRLFAGADILHLQVSEGGSFLRKGLLLRLGRLMGMTIVLHHHGARLGPFLDKSSRLTRRFVRRTAALADLNIALGQSHRRLLIERLGLPAGRVAVLPNACPDPGIRARTGDGTPMHFLVPAVLCERKGTAIFLAALARLGPGATATLAGEGDVARYARMAESLGLAGRVRFTGWLEPPDLLRLHAEADALVLPSLDEAMPIAILEALATGLPVIATPVGSIPEILVHDETALLVPPGDAAALASGMARLAEDPSQRRRLAANGRRLHAAAFDFERYMAHLLALYGALLDRQGSGAREPERQYHIGEH